MYKHKVKSIKFDDDAERVLDKMYEDHWYLLKYTFIDKHHIMIFQKQEDGSLPLWKQKFEEVPTVMDAESITVEN